MRHFRISIAMLAGVVLLVAVDLATIRFIFGLTPNARVPEVLIYVAFGLFPFVNVLLIGVCIVGVRRHRGRGSPFGAGFVAFGTVALLVVLAFCLIAPTEVGAGIERTAGFAQGAVLPFFKWLAQSTDIELGPLQNFVILLLAIALPTSGSRLLVACVGGMLGRKYQIIIVRRTSDVTEEEARSAVAT